MIGKYEKNFDEIWEKIEQVRLRTNQYQIIKIVAVSKSVGSDVIREFYKVGQRAFGENRVQDLKEKAKELEDIPIEWHFIGRLQKNKINHLLDINPFLIQSCDGLDLAKEIDKRAEVKGKKVNALLQINSAKEESKAGVMPEVAVEEYLKIKEECPNINLKGVMTIGAHTDDKELIKKSFETTYKIFEKLQKEGAKYCSMGMSDDFELAIECGSNMLRLGRILFK
ncbi:MAG: YggS family pyridoxal phosphate-dependent enzyme [Epsilonproteobacteria bacterium]|nr:YggS family pyridoxal phosphate-dependent enzyme [Campylobacterota bacterium]